MTMQSRRNVILVFAICGCLAASGVMSAFHCLCKALSDEGIAAPEASKCGSEKCCYADQTTEETPIPSDHDCPEIDQFDYTIRTKGSLNPSDFTQIYLLGPMQDICHEIVPSTDMSIARVRILVPPQPDQSLVASKTLLLA